MPRDAMAELSVDRVAALDPDGAVDGERRPDRLVDELVDWEPVADHVNLARRGRTAPVSRPSAFDAGDERGEGRARLAFVADLISIRDQLCEDRLVRATSRGDGSDPFERRRTVDQTA